MSEANLNYPSDFNTSADPAGRSIAFARLMAICALVIMLVIVFLCGILLWSARSERMTPFLISADFDSGEWRVVDARRGMPDYSTDRTMAESVLWKYLGERFSDIDMNTVTMTPNGELWIIDAPGIRAYAKVAKSNNEHSDTLGLYVAEFNFYKMDL